MLLFTAARKKSPALRRAAGGEIVKIDREEALQRDPPKTVRQREQLSGFFQPARQQEQQGAEGLEKQHRYHAGNAPRRHQRENGIGGETGGRKDDLQRLAEMSDPKVTIDTAGMSPEATELANRLARDISKLEPEDLSFLSAELTRRLR